MKSKEESVMGLFYEYPAKHWHFEDILIEAKTSRSKAAAWLKKFAREKMVKRVKEKGKMPYYVADYESFSYQNKKKIFALKEMEKSGFLSHLASQESTVIIFGSMARWDWHKKSDIDIFVYGKNNIDKISYERKLNREMQIFSASNEKDLKKMGEGLIKNILKGYLIKGDLDFIKIRTKVSGMPRRRVLSSAGRD